MMFETQATTNYGTYYSGGLRAKWIYDIADEFLPAGPLRTFTLSEAQRIAGCVEGMTLPALRRAEGRA